MIPQPNELGIQLHNGFRRESPLQPPAATASAHSQHRHKCKGGTFCKEATNVQGGAWLWDMGWIKSCCHCGVLVTRSHHCWALCARGLHSNNSFLSRLKKRKWCKIGLSVVCNIDRERFISHLEQLKDLKKKQRKGQRVGKKEITNDSFVIEWNCWIRFLNSRYTRELGHKI